VNITRTQIESWNPVTLADIGNSWTAMGSKIEGLFDQYQAAVANVNGGHWQGVAADAAVSRADSDRQAAIQLVDHLNWVAQIAINGFHEIDSPLQQARNAISGAERAGFTVSEDLTVSKPDMAAIEAMAAIKEQQAMLRWQNEITDAATAAANADNDVQNNLNAARGDLRVAFTSPATLDPDEARSDAAQLLGDPSDLSPAAEQRLVDAGLLTQSQLAALQSGEPVTIPAAQMEYLNALARSLDGESSQDIEAAMNKLPPDARQGVANALQLLSTPTVTASVRGDSQIPTSGAANLLPKQMYQSLTRKDLTTQGWQDIGGSPYDVINLNGVADNQAAARIAGMSSPALQHGTGLDTAVFDAGRQYLSAQVVAQNNPNDMYFVDGRGQEPTAPLTEPMFAGVANDRAVVAAEVSGPNGQAFLSDVFNNQWSDHGKSISELFQISPQDAVAIPGDRPSEVRATESGQIAWSVADYMSDHSKQLLDLPGDPGTAVGQRNPDLLINLSNDLAPYYSTFAGSHSVPGVGNFQTTQQLSDMYSVLATNPTAGVNAAAATYAQENILATAYGAGQAPSTYAQVAGQMQHALETGTASAESALNQGDVYRANWDEAVNGATYTSAYKGAGAVLSYIPLVGPTANNLINVTAPGVEPYVTGIVDQNAVLNPNNALANQSATNMLSSDLTVQNIANGVLIKDPSIINDPALAPYRATTDGHIYIKVDNLDAQANISDLLYSRYGINVQNWEDQFDYGMNSGTIATTGD
jgi:hypothetical protein